MRLKVEHTTLFEYDSAIYETAEEVRLQPRNDGEGTQRCLEFTLQLTPPGNIFHYTDYYGNKVHHFNILPSHKKIEIRATSLVETRNGYSPQEINQEMMLYDLLHQSEYVQFGPELEQFARQFAANNGFEGSNREQAENICRTINQSFIYESGVTHVHSTTNEVMSLGRGVCQDFAHVMLATCRYLNMPARYVSGYLYGGADSEGKTVASHAWCEVYCGAPFNGWVGFDPTHKTLVTDERYIKIGVGRDYADVPPLRGTFKGNATEKMTVKVFITNADNVGAQTLVS